MEIEVLRNLETQNADLRKEKHYLEEYWRTLKKEIENELFMYQTGWSTQDMETTIRNDEHKKVLRKIIKRIEQLEDEYDKKISNE